MDATAGSLIAASDYVWARLTGVADAEYFWERVAGCWSLRQANDGRWLLDGVKRCVGAYSRSAGRAVRLRQMNRCA